MEFAGRLAELAWLAKELDQVQRGGSRPARCVLLRGRRRVGKSRLVEQFLAEAGVPAVFFTAAAVGPVTERRDFAREVLTSDLPGRDLFTDVQLESWDAALRLLASALPDDGPSVVVLDEVPYLMAADPGFEGVLQRIWDRVLSRRAVLLILIGSDLSMMTALNDHGRPFHQRGTPMVLDPLTPADVAALLDLEPAEAIDAHLITGGLPLICATWEPGDTRAEFLRAALDNPTSALVVSGELTLAAEFPPEANPRAALAAIGSGERTFTAVQRASGLPTASLARALDTLARRGVVAAERPLSARPSKETRYHIEDAYLRFWLYFLGPHVAEIARGRGDRVRERIERSWASWRGRAVEPLVREALRRLPLAERLAGTGAVGGYWTRTNDVEVDLVGADRAPVAKRITFVGSIKWRDDRAFGDRDLAALVVARDRVPGADRDTPLVIVTRGARTVPGASITYCPADLLAAWQP